jgi:hypothetical protein
LDADLVEGLCSGYLRYIAWCSVSVVAVGGSYVGETRRVMSLESSGIRDLGRLLGDIEERVDIVFV